MTLTQRIPHSKSPKPSTWQEVFVEFVPLNKQDLRKPRNSSLWRGQISDAITKGKLPYSSIACQLLSTLLSYQGPYGRLDPSNETLADAIKRSLTAVKKALRELESAGVLVRHAFFATNGHITTERRQISVCWDSLMISKGAHSVHNSVSSSSVFSSSSLKKIVLENEIQQKPTASASFALQNEPQNPQDNVVDITPLVSEPSREKRMNDEFIEKAFAMLDFKESPGPAVKKEFKPTISLEELCADAENAVSSDSKNEDAPSDNRPPYTRLPHPWEMEREITKEAARSKRIDDIPNRYPNYKEVLERENCTLAEMKARMRANKNYEPFVKDQKWDLTCHPKYAILNEKEKDQRFIWAVERWLGEPKYGYSKKTRTMLKRGRKQADSCRAEYLMFVAAIYEHYGREMEIWKIGWATGWEVYLEWVDSGKPMPQKRGYYAKENRDFARAERKKKRGFVKRKSLSEEIDEQREILKSEMEEITAAYAL